MKILVIVLVILFTFNFQVNGTSTIIINTEAFNNEEIIGMQLKYCIYNSGITQTHVSVSGSNEFTLTPPESGQTGIINLSFYTLDESDSILINLLIDENASILGVSIDDIPLNPGYYKTEDNKIYFLTPRCFLEEINTLPVYPILKNGILFTPGVEPFSLFEISGINNCTNYSITIKDKYGNILYSSTDKESRWDGSTSFYNLDPENTNGYLVPKGTYSYEISVDNIIQIGKFIIQY